MQRSRQKLQNAIPMALLFATPTENINSWYYPRKYRRNVLYTGRFLPKIETIFFFRATSMYRRGKTFQFFFLFLFFILRSIYHRCIATTRTDLARRCVNERIDKGEKLVNFYGPPFLFHGIRIGTVEKKTILRWNDISFKPLNLKNIRLNESLIARKKIASYPLNNNYDSEEKIKNLIYIPTCTSRYIKTGK